MADRGETPEGKGEKDVLSATAYYEKANEYYEQGDYDRAIESYNMSVILNPNFLESYFNRALCYYNKKNYDKAIEDYTRAVDIDSDNPLIYNNRGDAYYRKQEFEKAIADYDKAISLNKDYLKAHYNRGLAYACVQDYETAVQNFTKVTELDANFSEAYNARGLAYEYLEKFDDAITDYEKAVELNPEFAEAKEHLEAARGKKTQKESGAGGEGVAAVKFMQKPKLNFNDIVGMEKVKELIREYIVYPLQDPELARKYGKLGGGGVILYGPPGCGKCVTGDTTVLLANGELKQIKELYEKSKSRYYEVIGDKEWAVENPGYEVWSLNKETLLMEKKKVLFAYQQKYKGIVYEVITRSKRKVRVTPEHPFITNENGVRKIKAKDLEIGFYIAALNQVGSPSQVESLNALQNFVQTETSNKELLLYKTANSFSSSDLIWEEVTEIRKEEIDDFVYDLTVDHNHTFVVGSGIIVHNTFIMKAAAGECGANFLNVKLSDVLDMYVGNTEKNIRNVFEAARKNSPCIVFIDEIDGLGGKREQMKESGQYMRMAVNQLLYEMDGVESRNENVLVVAATNSPWDVDPALRRAGRFTKLIYVGEPDQKSREALFQYHSKNRPNEKGVSWGRLARATDGYAAADMKAICDDAAAIPWLEALKTGKHREIRMADYLKAVRKKRSSLPPWYESAKKEIGKQEEVETVEGKEYKRIKEPKMPAGEREYFRELVGLIEKRNQPWFKTASWVWRNFALYEDIITIPLVIIIGYLFYLVYAGR